jgi:3-deoxy-D-manno-octulosonate 8-phosphate phosphatase (KDO 8-P phosphatase)
LGAFPLGKRVIERVTFSRRLQRSFESIGERSQQHDVPTVSGQRNNNAKRLALRDANERCAGILQANEAGAGKKRTVILPMSDEPVSSPIGPAAVLARAAKIKLFLMDVDGTLTDGGVCLIAPLAVEPGNVPVVTEMKVFNAQDGQGLSLAHRMGLLTGFITGRRSPAVLQRAQELHVSFVYLGQANKTQAYEECMQRAGVGEEEIAYLGDDLPDIPLAKRAGLSVCVADGAPELKQVCHYTTERAGGRGAAREVVELILKAQGRWEAAVPLALA